MTTGAISFPSKSITFSDGTIVVIGPMSATVTATPAPPPPPPSNEVRFTAYITGYTWWSNSPPGDGTYTGGHADGNGTYANPITMAVGFVGSTLDYPDGTLFYIPNLRKYFKVGDECDSCHAGSGGLPWLDLWLDGRTTSAATSAACANSITGNHLVIKNPASNYAVVPGVISTSSGCAAQFGDTVVTV